MIATQVLKTKVHDVINKVNGFKYAICYWQFTAWPLGRADPECVLGHLLKILFKNDDFMNAVRILMTNFKL